MNNCYITGRGLVTPLGVGIPANIEKLKSGASGIAPCQDFIEKDLDSKVAGVVKDELVSPLLDRKLLRFCPRSAVMSVIAVEEALREAGLGLDEVKGKRIALVGGVAGGAFAEVHDNAKGYEDHEFNLRHVSPFIVPRVMPSSAVSIISMIFGLVGESYDISAACSSGALAVMVASRLVKSGMYDIVIAGGAENIDWVSALGFTASRALSRSYNDNPSAASRPFDAGRDGFVMGEGAGYVVLESEASIARRGARAITKISGFGANSNAKDMVAPDAERGAEVMRLALADAGLEAGDIAYINTHGTSTKVGDPIELASIDAVFGAKTAVNSTKSQTGHLIGATGAVEIIYTSLMMEHGFISPTVNLTEPIPEFAHLDLVKELREGVDIPHALSNNFAFGGSNVCAILSRCD